MNTKVYIYSHLAYYQHAKFSLSYIQQSWRLTFAYFIKKILKFIDIFACKIGADFLSYNG